MDRGFYFESRQGNTYFYNDIDGTVNKTDVKKEKCVVYGEESLIKEHIDICEIKDYIKNYGLKQLILIVTEDCNIRCRYCVYSGEYTNSRTHTYKYMDSDTAKKAVSKYLKEFESIKRKNPFQIPTIGFYGGEPLLNFKLIKEIVQYCKDIYNKTINFTMTTNITMLNEEIASFLAENQFVVSVSLNGDKMENDRLRVFPDNSGTYDIIIDNLKLLKEKYKEIYKTKCNIIITYDNGTDLIRLREFINHNADLLPGIARVNPVSNVFTNWYDRYSNEENNKFKKDLKRLKLIYKQQVINGKVEDFLKILFGTNYFQILNRQINLKLCEIRPKGLSETSTCIPGTKIAVDCSGKLHCCEKVNFSIDIGNVDTWLDYNKIENIMNKFKYNISDKCNKCPIQRVCNMCYAMVVDENGEFKREYLPDCDETIERTVQAFEETWDMLEDGADSDIILFKKN